MNNDIKELLDLKGVEDIEITSIDIEDTNKIITLQKRLTPMYCPDCGCVMHSQGFYNRKVDHSILSDGYKLILKVRQRKYRCTNRDCNRYLNEEFGFVEKYQHKSYATPYLILNDLREISVTAAYVARQRHVSDTYVHEVVLRYLNFNRLKLSEIISIDEVFMDMGKDARYCLVIRDFINDEIIDILPNRNKDTIGDFFRNIPKEERDKVKYLICDMYKPYINLTNTYLRNSKAIIDSFHVIQWINNRINLFIYKIKKIYQERDNQRRKELNYKENVDFTKRKDSKEVYLLKNHKWVLLSNEDNIEYKPFRYLNKRLGQYVNTKDIENKFLALNPEFPILRQLKQMYLDFNSDVFQTKEEKIKQFDKLIEDYKSTNIDMFKDFATLLENNKEPIIASFDLVEINDKETGVIETYRRMSNGPMEGFNRVPKDMKRNSRGFLDFEYLRNRLLWATRKEPSILGIPKPKEEIKATHKGKKRGPYKKRNK